MCGRYTLFHPIGKLFDLPDSPDLPPRYNIAPTQDVPVVVAAGGGGRQLRRMHWGFIPPWAKDRDFGARLINARAETVAEKPTFRGAFRRQRCLIPADGFFEWQKLDGVPGSHQAGSKQPFHIRLPGGEAFAFAGLWGPWQDPAGGLVESCTILTTAPNVLIQDIHDRMPVILPPERYAFWLDPASKDMEKLAAILQPYPAADMICQPVSRAVNDPKHDAPDCIASA
jgi:putative SOS response-associated peptidase YedK